MEGHAREGKEEEEEDKSRGAIRRFPNYRFASNFSHPFSKAGRCGWVATRQIIGRSWIFAHPSFVALSSHKSSCNVGEVCGNESTNGVYMYRMAKNRQIPEYSSFIVMPLPEWLRITGRYNRQIAVVQTFDALIYNRKTSADKICICHTINILWFYRFLAKLYFVLCSFTRKHILYVFYLFATECDLHFIT